MNDHSSLVPQNPWEALKNTKDETLNQNGMVRIQHFRAKGIFQGMLCHSACLVFKPLHSLKKKLTSLPDVQ